MVGGAERGTPVTKILKYDASVWSHVGDLQIARYDFTLAFDGNELLVIGGWGNDFTSTDAT